MMQGAPSQCDALNQAIGLLAWAWHLRSMKYCHHHLLLCLTFLTFLTLSSMVCLTFLWGRGIDNIDLCSMMINLQILALSMNREKCIKLLENYMKLEELYLRENEIGSLSELGASGRFEAIENSLN
ncbi:leucine Rich Repeat family protein [Loa loa]|uniref:Leucine Rich Repeat family protein n=1 Tax=Loa loa TaxID=7209 RepID=A0A1S0TWT8_LOALO|nr:leucine Rich Repeat family protein [Loa loa]EFO21170.1 leucine Rich Repeat family protein [Loa loa]